MYLYIFKIIISETLHFVILLCMVFEITTAEMHARLVGTSVTIIRCLMSFAGLISSGQTLPYFLTPVRMLWSFPFRRMLSNSAAEVEDRSCSWWKTPVNCLTNVFKYRRWLSGGWLLCYFVVLYKIYELINQISKPAHMFDVIYYYVMFLGGHFYSTSENSIYRRHSCDNPLVLPR